MKKKLTACVIHMVLVLSLAGCGNDRPAETGVPPAGPDRITDIQASDTGRQDGERFEAVIMLEGMEETVGYEHIINGTIGFEMDYDYESLIRSREPGRERFISVYDAPGNPENYLEVTYSPEDADTVSEAISEALSEDYDIIRNPSALDRAGSCIRIGASEGKGGGTPDYLQTVYIIPAGDGSLIAAAHYSFESAEGFGRRFSYIMNTLAVIERDNGMTLSDEQALAAVRSYCLIRNPDLESIVNDGVYPVYWAVSSSDEHEIAVLFRSYTGAQIRYHIDRVTGETYATESVPEISPEEERTGESLNIWEYLP